MSPNSLEKRAADARHSHLQLQILGLRTPVSIHTTLKLLAKGLFQNLHILQVQPNFLL